MIIYNHKMKGEPNWEMNALQNGIMLSSFLWCLLLWAILQWNMHASLKICGCFLLLSTRFICRLSFLFRDCFQKMITLNINYLSSPVGVYQTIVLVV